MSLLARRAMMGKHAELPKTSWIDGDISTIKQMLDDAQAGEAVDFSNWHIGDARHVTIQGNEYDLILAHRFTGAPASASAAYAFNGTAKYPTWAVLCTPQMGTAKYMNVNIAQNYFSSACALNVAISTRWNWLQQIPEGQLFKEFICVVGKENKTAGRTYGTYSQSKYLSALACKEVGLSNNYNSDENAALIKFDYFDSASKRNIAGNERYWLRSPARGSSSSYQAFGIIASTGSLVSSGVTNSYQDFRLAIAWPSYQTAPHSAYRPHPHRYMPSASVSTPAEANALLWHLCGCGNSAY